MFFAPTKGAVGDHCDAKLNARRLCRQGYFKLCGLAVLSAWFVPLRILLVLEYLLNLTRYTYSLYVEDTY